MKHRESGVIVIDNKNEYCFKYAVCASLHYNDKHREHPKRHTQYEEYFDNYNWKVINFHVVTRYIETFQNNNPDIIVKAYSNYDVNPHATKEKNFIKEVNLFTFRILHTSII